VSINSQSPNYFEANFEVEQLSQNVKSGAAFSRDDEETLKSILQPIEEIGKAFKKELLSNNNISASDLKYLNEMDGHELVMLSIVSLVLKEAESKRQNYRINGYAVNIEDVDVD
jgi:Zn-dependent oligopeptidase